MKLPTLIKNARRPAAMSFGSSAQLMKIAAESASPVKTVTIALVDVP